MMDTTAKTISINGVDYIRADSIAPKPSGNRAVIVVDRGWIFAGDVTEKDGRILLSNAVWVFSWENIGFSGVISSPEKADIRPIDDVDIPIGSEIYRIPVHPKWGL